MPEEPPASHCRYRGLPAAAAFPFGQTSTLLISALLVSALLVSALLVSALATTALDVSGTSGRADDMALVMAVAGWAEPAEASFICPALIWTVLTLTGFMGSDEPGMAAIDCVWITPLVNGAGSGLACAGGTARCCLRNHRSCRRCSGTDRRCGGWLG